MKKRVVFDRVGSIPGMIRAVTGVSAMNDNNQEMQVCGFCGWFKYEEDRWPALEHGPGFDQEEEIWSEVEQMKAEAEANGEDMDEEWMGQKFLEELDREYENEPPTASWAICAATRNALRANPTAPLKAAEKSSISSCTKVSHWMTML